jgi:hypothetical protein
MVWILLTFMIWWDHPNLLTLSSSTYKRRGAHIHKFILSLCYYYHCGWLRSFAGSSLYERWNGARMAMARGSNV